MRVRVEGKDGLKVVNLNRRLAIREKCLNCSGWTPSGVAHCGFDNCLLYSYRMGHGNQKPAAREKVIRKYCRQCCNGLANEVSKCPSRDCPLFAFRNTALDRSVEIKSERKTMPIGASPRTVL